MKSETGHQHHHTEEALTHLRLVVQNLATIEEMIRAAKPCAEIVRRLSGCLTALTECRNIIAKDHLVSCVREALKPGQEQTLAEISTLFQEFAGGANHGSHH